MTFLSLNKDFEISIIFYTFNDSNRSTQYLVDEDLLIVYLVHLQKPILLVVRGMLLLFFMSSLS